MKSPREPEVETSIECICEKHGAYVATLLLNKLYSRCDACEVEWAERRRQQDEERKLKERRERDEENLRRHLRDSGLVGRFARATFDTFKADLPAQRMALQACRDFAEDFDLNRYGGLWLVGPPGVGKSHLGAAVTSHVIREKRQRASLHSVHAIMSLIKASFGVKAAERSQFDATETTEELMDRLGSQPLLIIDEIGATRGSDWESEQLFAIIDDRYQLERPTCLISNLPAPELKIALGDRGYDRLREGAKMVPMNWPSHRGAPR